MYRLFILIAILMMGCNSRVQDTQTSESTDTVVVEKPVPPPPTEKVYTNERFKDVVVQKTGDHTFLVTGKGQIFEDQDNRHDVAGCDLGAEQAERDPEQAERDPEQAGGTNPLRHQFGGIVANDA